SHCSGFERETRSLGVHLAGEPGPTTAQFLERILTTELSSQSGGPARYSNINYALLAAIIERVSGQSFHSFLSRRLFDPLGMKSTGVGYAKLPQEDRAAGYFASWSMMDWMMRWLFPSSLRHTLIARDDWFGDKELRPFELDGQGFGGLVGSIADLGRFAAFHLDLNSPEFEAVLGRDYRLQMRQRGNQAFGLGWTRMHVHGQAAYGHTGGGPGFKSHICLIPAQGFGAAALSNRFAMRDPDLGALAALFPQHA
ncbi:MAG: serine hydrolase domain-containing protein, partial [Giesbergeria sp.]